MMNPNVFLHLCVGAFFAANPESAGDARTRLAQVPVVRIHCSNHTPSAEPAFGLRKRTRAHMMHPLNIREIRKIGVERENTPRAPQRSRAGIFPIDWSLGRLNKLEAFHANLGPSVQKGLVARSLGWRVGHLEVAYAAEADPGRSHHRQALVGCEPGFKEGAAAIRDGKMLRLVVPRTSRTDAMSSGTGSRWHVCSQTDDALEEGAQLLCVKLGRRDWRGRQQHPLLIPNLEALGESSIHWHWLWFAFGVLLLVVGGLELEMHARESRWFEK